MNKEFLRRYMELKYVLPLLKSGRIEFLAPNKWDDTNDSHFLEAYRQKKKLKSLLAVCFTSVSERIHHWERFGRKGKNGSEAICVEFNKATLLAAFSGNPHIRSGEVKYWRLDDLEKALPSASKWPFVKRLPYCDEHEFRIIYEDAKRGWPLKALPISIDSIKNVIVGPYATDARRDEIKAMLVSVTRSIGAIEITKTTVLSNKRWKRIVDRARASASNRQMR